MMTRVFGMVLASSLAVGLASIASAQESVLPNDVDGAFGTPYVQPPPVSGVPGNRWDMLAGPSYAEGIPYGGAFVEQRPARAGLRSRNTPQTYARGPAPYRTALPTTRLYGAGGFMPSTYTPYNRAQAYGEAYGMGPYGSNYYSGYWHGQPIYSLNSSAAPSTSGTGELNDPSICTAPEYP